MPGDEREPKRHFLLEGIARTEQYRSPQQGGSRQVVPEQDRAVHGGSLLAQIEALGGSRRGATPAASGEDDLGLTIEFESFPDVELAFERLPRERYGIELLNVRDADDRTYATVYVPDGKMPHFERLVRRYLADHHGRAGQSLDNKSLLNTIQTIRAATLRALWTDDAQLFPSDPGESIWWEVWLLVRRDRGDATATFRNRAGAQGLVIPEGELRFPERTVVLAYGSSGAMTRSMLTLNSIAELRRAKDTAEFFDALPPVEQQEWLDDLLGRVSHVAPAADAPHICLLDTGVNRGHPLLAPALDADDLHTVEPGWGSDDGHGHGTGMAGLALAGDLTPLLSGSGAIEIKHRLESVKLLPEDRGNSGTPQLHGALTTEAVARPEITAPMRQRVFGMAVTARDSRDRGRPSAWSAAVDRLALDPDGNRPRLLVVSAGNIQDNAAWANYPNSVDTDGVHDPAQAWNALTVGAHTQLVHIAELDAGDYSPIAAAGGLSPFSTTSVTWQAQWPLKPDIVLEGGNAAKDGLGAVTMPSLSLLTTHHRPTERPFATTNATSAATALATRMAAQVMVGYPDLWPETVRALIVHSAEWTEEMRRMFLPASGPSKRDYQQLVQRCGFGVPNLERALWSAANALTMVVQEEVYPFRRIGSGEPTLRDMQLYEMPWPKERLESLESTPVEMRVTLSYFIEPSPSARGPRSRYRYESHGLRFDVQRPLESLSQFQRRVNAAAREEDDGAPGGGDDSGWIIGKQIRHRGSLHQDMWRGEAAKLASRGALAVYPSLGWWKTRPKLGRYDQPVRYALVVSINAPNVDVDLYSEVENRIGVTVSVET